MEFLQTGKIIKTVGLKGELKLISTTFFAEERYKKGNKVYIFVNDKYKQFTVKNYRTYGGFDFLILSNIDSIELANNYIGLEIFINKNESTLKEGLYYYDDLKGCDVFFNENYVGTVEKIEEFPAQDTLLVKKENGKKLLIPFVDAFIKKVEITKKRIEVTLIDGMDE